MSAGMNIPHSLYDNPNNILIRLQHLNRGAVFMNEN
jgi:hypothetical protein